MKHETIGLIAVFIVFIVAIIFGSMGESFPLRVPKTTTVVVPFSVP